MWGEKERQREEEERKISFTSSATLLQIFQIKKIKTE
jgi:hypothetical protein